MQIKITYNNDGKSLLYINDIVTVIKTDQNQDKKYVVEIHHSSGSSNCIDAIIADQLSIYMGDDRIFSVFPNDYYKDKVPSDKVLAESEINSLKQDKSCSYDITSNINTPKTYTKKPIAVEAMIFKFKDLLNLQKFVGDKLIQIHSIGIIDPAYYAKIKTLEGVITASEGDYIIKGITGEFYPCKPNIFEMTYDKAKSDNKKDFDDCNPFATF